MWPWFKVDGHYMKELVFLCSKYYSHQLVVATLLLTHKISGFINLLSLDPNNWMGFLSLKISSWNWATASSVFSCLLELGLACMKWVAGDSQRREWKLDCQFSFFFLSMQELSLYYSSKVFENTYIKPFLKVNIFIKE